jgi:hypothetical protein
MSTSVIVYRNNFVSNKQKLKRNKKVYDINKYGVDIIGNIIVKKQEVSNFKKLTFKVPTDIWRKIFEFLCLPNKKIAEGNVQTFYNLKKSSVFFKIICPKKNQLCDDIWDNLILKFLSNDEKTLCKLRLCSKEMNDKITKSYLQKSDNFKLAKPFSGKSCDRKIIKRFYKCMKLSATKPYKKKVCELNNDHYKMEYVRERKIKCSNCENEIYSCKIKNDYYFSNLCEFYVCRNCLYSIQ